MSVIRLRPEMQTVAPVIQDATAPLQSASVPSPVLGLNAPVAGLEAMKVKPVTAGETVKSTIQESIVMRALRGMSFLAIPSEDGFDVAKAMRPQVGEYNPDELGFLYGARSTTELHKRIEAVQESRTNAANMAANPVTAFASSLLDIDLAIGGGVGLLSKASRLTRVAASVGATVGALKLASEGGVVTPLEATLWTVGAVAAAIPQVKHGNIAPIEHADDVPTGVTKETVEEVVEEGGEKLYNVVENAVEVPSIEIPAAAERPVKYIQTTAGDTFIREANGEVHLATSIPPNAIQVDTIDELLEETLPTVDEVNFGKDLDYPIKDVPEAGAVAKTVEVLDEPTQQIVKQTPDGVRYTNTSWEGPAIVGRQTTVRNAVATVLALRNDLPQSVRNLAKHLYDALDGEQEVPIFFKRNLDNVGGDESIAGYFQWAPSRPVQVQVRIPKSMAGNLEDLITELPEGEVRIILHEAMHSKVDATLEHTLRGTQNVPRKLKSAVNEINRVMQYVQKNADSLPDVLKNDFDFNYGLTNIREFVASLFTSPALVDYLKQVEHQPMWKRVLRSIANIITGEAPKGTALDTVADAIDTILSNPTHWSSNIDYAAWSEVRRTAKSAYVQSMQKSGTIRERFAEFQKAITHAVSNFEAVAGLSSEAEAFARKLLADSTGTDANSAVHYARAALLQGNVGHMRVQAGIAQSMVEDGWNIIRRWKNPIKYRQALSEFSSTVYDAIAENARKFREGAEVTAHPNPRVQRVLTEFSDSNWADTWLGNIKAAGVEGAQDVEKNPWYLPREHNYSKILEALRNNPNLTFEDFVGMYTQQFQRMFADQGIEPATAKKLAKQMLRNLQDRGMGNTDWRSGIAGMRYDEIREALELSGIDPDTIKQFMGEVEIAGEGTNKARNLKRRLEFDMTMEYKTIHGEIIYPEMFVNKDVATLMEGYGRRMAGRVGLAKAGFEDLRALDGEVQRVLNSIVEGDPRAAKELIDNNIKYLLGMPTGERVPDLFRNLTTLSTGTVLGMSGVFQLGDTALMMQEYGIGRTLKAMATTAWGSNALALARDPAYGKRLRDVLEGELVLQGMYRPLLTHLDDNFELGHMGVFTQMVQHLGQNTRFASGLEFVRRKQVRMVASMIADSMEGAIRGEANSITLLRKYGLSDDLLNRIKAAKAVSDDISTWGSDLLLDVQAVGINAADAVVLENRLGDIAPWLQFSSVGKVIMPYLSFVSGAWNKLLRRRYKMDGVLGVAMAMAYQMPASALSAIASLELKGKELDAKEVAIRAIVQTPIMSWFGYALDFATQGPANSIAALSVADKMYTATKGVVKGNPDAGEILGAMPWISLIPGVKLYGATIAEPDKKKKE